MQLIGMLDSPYVRRVAISMKLLGLPFVHRSLSVFRNYPEFQKINPMVKAPTLVCDDGEILMESTLIIDYVESLVPAGNRLMPEGVKARRDALKNIGVALVACEKAVQRHYEQALRPVEKQHAPWLERVTHQMCTAFDELEKIVGTAQPWLHGERLLQDDLTIAVAWRFAQFVVADALKAERYPALAAFSARAETLPEFVATPLD
ncbi:MAG: glutathione S-transferase [Betaproteobacteria bacterium]